MLAVLALVGCGLETGAPEGAPPRTAPQDLTRARSWVRVVAADDTHVYWSNYDTSSGKSTRATIDRVPIEGGEREEVTEERHPPVFLTVHGDHVYWVYEDGPLKRVAKSGGEEQVLLPRSRARCFQVDDDGLFVIEDADVLRIDPSTGEQTVLAKRSLGGCAVPVGDHVFWTERKGLYRVSKAGGDAEKLIALDKPDGLLAHDGALFTCLDDVLTRIEPTTGKTTPVRGYCKAQGLAVGERAHWFWVPYFKGWPPMEHARLVEVTSDGISWLYDGEGVSPPAVVGDQLVWFGRPDGGPVDWQGYSVPVP